MNGLTARHIPKEQTHDWIKRKHYAHRIPAIMYAFGLYDDALILQGVCTYGPPARMLNKGYGVFGGTLEVETLELNRLVVNDGLPANALSFFIGQTFKLLQWPACLVSYADENAGHHGYIYQATNWLYTGHTDSWRPRNKFLDASGNEIHESTITHHKSIEDAHAAGEITIEPQEGKHRYIYLLGSRSQKKQMRAAMVYKVLPYPKGDNDRYDADHEPAVQRVMF